MAHHAGAYPSFFYVKATKSIITLPPLLDGCQSIARITPPPPQHFIRLPWKIAGTHLFSWMVRGTVRVTCFAQEHNTLTRPQVPCPDLSTQSTASTIRLPRVPLWTLWQTLKKSLRTLRQITNRRHYILFVQTFFKWLPGSHGCKSVSTLAQPFLYFTQSCLILQREWFSLLAYIGFLFYSK